MLENKHLNSKGDLKGLSLFMMGGALFSMHFGASSMVFPMNWGKESGTSVWLAFLGAFVTSLLLTLLAYIALARGKGTYNGIVKKALPETGLFYTNLTIIVLGPLYAIPRMSAAAWDAIRQATDWNPDSRIPIILFSIVYYVVTYWFLMNPGKTMDRISNILFPFLICIVIIVIAKGLISPIATPMEKTYASSAFAYGFTEGYSTAEILCALTFGIVILNSLREKGVSEGRMNMNIIKVGIVGIGMLTCTHLGHMLIGAYTGGTIDLNYVSLYTAVAFKLLGGVGGTLFAGALLLASLTTAIGMTSATAEFFVDAFDGRLKYKHVALAILGLSTVIGCLGMADIMTYFAPILDMVYPAAIVLVLYYTFMPDCLNPRRLNMCRWGMLVALLFGLFDAIHAYNLLFGMNLSLFETFYNILPLSAAKLAWVPWSIVGLVLGYLAYRGEQGSAVEQSTTAQ